MRRRTLVLMVLVALVAVTGTWAEGQSETESYPMRDITLVIGSSQGGGTDTWTRHLARLMEAELGVNIIASNLPGANGGNGATQVWNQPHDGYSVLGMSETTCFYGVNDVGPTAENWEFFIGGGSPGGIAVHGDSDYDDIQDLVAAANDSPNRVTISNSGNGKLWHIKAIQLEDAAGVEFQHVSYNGSGPARQALLTGEVDALSASLGEAIDLARGGQAKILVISEAEGMDVEGFGYIPSVPELYPGSEFGYQNLFQWLGFLMPADAPEEALRRFGEAFEAAINHPSTQELAESRISQVYGIWGQEAKELALNMEQVASWMSEDLGLAKVSPRELGIPRP